MIELHPGADRRLVVAATIGLLVVAASLLAFLSLTSVRHDNRMGIRLLLGLGAASGAVAGLLLAWLWRSAPGTRRATRAPAPNARPDHRVERFGAVAVNLDARTVHRNGEPVDLTRREFDLLRPLLADRGTVRTRVELLRDGWDHSAAVETRAVDVHISALRKKVEPDPSSPRHIKTVTGVGYRLDS